MNIIQVGILSVAGVLFAVQIKQDKPELAIFLSIAVSIIVFLSIMDSLEMLVNTVRSIVHYIEIDVSYITTLLKMLGITYLSEFSSAICKDAGYQTIAAQIEMCGKIAILGLSMPILLGLLKILQEFLR